MRIAIDTGGTFTDCVYTRDGEDLHILKVPSTPADPAAALLGAVSSLVGGAAEVRHGTTVGTNALLERKGARVGFVTTAGFENTIAIGRQARPKLYDLLWTSEPPLVAEQCCFGVTERVASDGAVLQPVTREELLRLKDAVSAAAPEAVALSFLFSFANPANERAVAAALRELNLPVSVSHEILPEFREYERASTITMNAYLVPVMQRYLGRIDAALTESGIRFHVMQSSGGIVSPSVAAREPVRTLLSGPAGGVVGAAAIAREAGFKRILTFDMGGTSTDVSLLAGGSDLASTKESLVMGLPVAVPMLDIHTVGAGGGSLAIFDRGGALKVGPQSAGAEPGPICYGRGELPTVTDANLLLGRLDAAWQLAGSLQLNAERTRDYFAKSKGPLGTAEEFADGILRVVNARMEKALRHISVERGHDPRDFVLVSFGGAGPLHAVALARALRIPTVLVPNFPGALSAYGILISDFVRDYSRTVMLKSDDASLDAHFGELESLGSREFAAEGLAGTAIRSLDLRYAGQGYELQVPWSACFSENFHRLHEQHYGYSDRERRIEVVNVRVRMAAQGSRNAFRQADKNGGSDVGSGERAVYYEGQWVMTKLIQRQHLPTGARVAGPALLLEYSATTWLPPQSAAHVDDAGNLLIEVNT